MSADVKALVVRLQKGDDRALKGLYKLYARLVLHICRQHRLTDQDSEDVLQETFMTLLEKSDTLEDATKVKGWLCMTARHKAVDILRRQKKQIAVASEESTEPLVSEQQMNNLECQLVTEEILAIEQETGDTLLRLRFIEGRSVKEIAEAQGVAVSTITTNLTRKRREFSERIKKRISSLRESKSW